MAIHQHTATADAAPATALGTPLRSSLVSFVSKIRASMRACADYYAAAAMYEQLAALSDAELARRGLSRPTLARDVLAACDRRVPTFE